MYFPIKTVWKIVGVFFLIIITCVLGSARTGLIFTGIQEGNPGKDTAGWADATWPNRAVYSIPCAVMLGSSGGGSWAAGTHSWLRSAIRQFGLGERLCRLCGLYCVFSLAVLLLFLFPLFAVLLNCPYPNTPVSACFFPFSSAPLRREGRPCGAFVAGCSQNQNINLTPNVGHR